MVRGRSDYSTNHRTTTSTAAANRHEYRQKFHLLHVDAAGNHRVRVGFIKKKCGERPLTWTEGSGSTASRVHQNLSNEITPRPLQPQSSDTHEYIDGNFVTCTGFRLISSYAMLS